MTPNLQQLAARTAAPRPERLDDARIARMTLQALQREHIVPGERFTVTVVNGWLTLRGQAANPVERAAAECVARYVPGVLGVRNRLALPLAHAGRP